MRKPKEDPFSGTGSGMLFMQAKNEVLILDCLKETPKPAKQVAKELGMSDSTAYKLLNEFVEDGIVESQPERRGRSKLYKLKEI